MIRLVVALLVLLSTAFVSGRAEPPEQPTENPDHVTWVAQCLQRMGTIKSGMTRAIMKLVTWTFSGFLFLSSGPAQQPDTRSEKGVIYGTVVAPDGTPAMVIGLEGQPLGVGFATLLPHTRTDIRGHYRLTNIPWWGRYTVCADDANAGYSVFSTGCPDPGQTREVTLSPEHPEGEFNFRLPPKAGFLQVHVTNRRNGRVIPGVVVSVTSVDHPDRPILTQSSDSTHFVLLPPDKDLLLHITSPRFHEWDESAVAGKIVRVTSGSRLTLDVQLEPSE